MARSNDRSFYRSITASAPRPALPPERQRRQPEQQRHQPEQQRRHPSRQRRHPWQQQRHPSRRRRRPWRRQRLPSRPEQRRQPFPSSSRPSASQGPQSRRREQRSISCRGTPNVLVERETEQTFVCSDSHRGAEFYRFAESFETSTKIVRNWRQLRLASVGKTIPKPARLAYCCVASTTCGRLAALRIPP
jgi:hypothetical protein